MKSSIHERLFNTFIRFSSVSARSLLPKRIRGRHSMTGTPGDTTLTLAWANSSQRRQIVELARNEGRQTMNLRTMPGARLAILLTPDGSFAGWAGMDAETHPDRPEVFSQFVFPAYRGRGLGALLEHVWWAYLSSRGCRTAYMRMEIDSNDKLFEHRLASGYCREASPEELGTRFVSACRGCELYGNHCSRQAYLSVDVEKALDESVKRRGSLDIDRLPARLRIDMPFEIQPGRPRAVIVQ